jgi:hypothetical protein
MAGPGWIYVLYIAATLILSGGAIYVLLFARWRGPQLGARKGACGFPCLILIHLPGGRGSTGIVIPIEVLAGPATCEPDFKAAGVGNAPERMWDDANAVDHGPLALPSTLVWRITIKFNVRAMNPSRLSVSVKDDLDRHSTSGGFRNSENHSCLDFGFRSARFS